MKETIAKQLALWANTMSQESVTQLVVEKLGKSADEARRYEEKINAFTFTYSTGDNNVAGFLVAPKKYSSQLPVIIFNRGGTADFGLICKGHLFTRIATMASWGYIVVGTQYPGNSISDGVEERGGKSDIDSILKLYDLVQLLSVADESRIGMYGESRGGMMTYLCMKEVSWIKAALTVGGLTNLNRSLEYRPEMVQIFKKHFGNSAKARDARSAVKWADKMNKSTPLCLIHGDADERVKVDDARELADRLDTAQHPYSLHIFKNGNHGLTNVKQRRDTIIKDWFKKHVTEIKDERTTKQH